MNKKANLSLLSIALSVFVVFALGTAQEGFAQQHNLTVINTGAGYGTVTSSPQGIKCGAICAKTFSDGKKVTLKAKADADSSFAGWAGGGCTGIDPCSIIMDSDVTVTATFDQKTPEISLSTDMLEFNVLKPGGKVRKTLVISNIGTGNLIVTVSGLEGTDFSISGKSTFVIKPNKSYNLKVTYASSASETVATDGQTIEEPVSGLKKVEIGTSSQSEDIERSAAGTSSGASDVVDDPVMVLTTNDPQNPALTVELAPLVQPQPPQPVSAFIKVPTWQLDITWSANDAYEDSDWSAELEMTTTARYVLKQSDKRPDIGWGRWHVESVQSWNMTFSSSLVDKRTNDRTDYSATNQLMPGSAAVFQVGSFYNPSGYELEAGLPPILKVTSTVLGITEGLVALLTTDIYKPPPSGFCTGPLPATGLTIHGSLVIPVCVPPFCGGAGNVPDTTRVGIQYVLQPYRK